MNATIYCGYCCKTGAGLEKPNIVAAARYYEYGARAGVAAAQYELARIYIDKEMGDACFIGGANPYIGCERWLKKAAEQNYIYAEELLADKYYEGAYIVSFHWERCKPLPHVHSTRRCQSLQLGDSATAQCR